ncbi:hypothetical protein GCM10010483_05670 [Actinokineospora diospyrosa]
MFKGDRLIGYAIQPIGFTRSTQRGQRIRLPDLSCHPTMVQWWLTSRPTTRRLPPSVVNFRSAAVRAAKDV